MRTPKHFSLPELLKTNHAQLGNNPDWQHVLALNGLACDHLDRIREKWGVTNVNSAFRSRAVNDAVGGVGDSAHTFGCAADIWFRDKKVRLEDVAKWIVYESGLEFDQLIHEGTFLHYGIARPGYGAARREVWKKVDGKYTKWVP